MSAARALAEGGRLWTLVNFALLQGTWFGCVLGAAAGRVEWAWACGAAALATHFALLRERRADLRMVAAAVALGAVVETVCRGVGAVEARGDPFPAPLAPSWFLVLWAVFGTTIRHSLSWLRGRLVLAAAFGAVGAPLSLLGGARLGAVHVADDPLLFWGACGAAWAVALPLLVALAERLRPGDAPRAANA